jgi:hypothetical protein
VILGDREIAALRQRPGFELVLMDLDFPNDPFLR